LFDMMQQQNLINIDEKLQFVESYLVTYDNYSDEQIKDIKQIFSRFKSELKKRWTLAHKKKETFITKNNVWLDEKAIVQETKLKMQQDFKNKMGLIVDVPKPGFGNTNDGNTSRRFFADPDLAAEITGVDINLIFRFKVILEVISSGHEVDTEKFSAYATETAELYIRLYPWHPMTPTMHKILVHGALVIQDALLPIGQLSGEAAEARNKHFRLYRQNFARKFSRVSCNLDVLNRLLLSSDPVITGMRPVPKKKTKPFLKETIAMLRPALPYLSSHTEESDDEESSEERHVSSDEEAWQAASSD
jgi:hypothetical protein